jgi:uncharacterized protein YjiS (DUF1127 family)
MPNTELEFLVLNRRRLSPVGRSLLRRLVIERAKTLRAEFLGGLWRQTVSWYRAKAAIAQLRALDDAALKDIGLHRSGIETAVVEGLAQAKPRSRQVFPEKPQLCLQRTG